MGLILLGIAMFAGTRRWMSTRIAEPVNLPISLAPGHIRTGPFRVNLRTDYEVYLAIGYDWQWDQAHPGCNPYQHLQTRWVLYRDGKIVARLDQPTTLPWPSWFAGSPGTYELDLEVLNDFRCLDSADPHLRLVADTEGYESAAFAIELAAIVVLYVGFCSLVFVPAVRALVPREAPIGVAALSTASQNFQWAQRLPLRRPISGLPGFGLVGGFIYAIMAMVMMVLTAPVTSTGVWVHLLKQGASPDKADAWTEAVVVHVRDAGAGRSPDLYVNSTPVAWEDLDRALKQKLAARREWVVYVDGDERVAWQNVVRVIDVAHGLQAKVVLLGRDTRKRSGYAEVSPISQNYRVWIVRTMPG